MDKAKLLVDRVTGHTAEVEIEGVGTVTVRSLSRWEMIQAGRVEDDPLKQERFILSRAMVDPEMGEDDIAAWQKSSPPGEINAVATAVNKLSGIAQGAAKRGVSEVRGES